MVWGKLASHQRSREGNGDTVSPLSNLEEQPGTPTQEEGNAFSVCNGSESDPAARLLQSHVEQVFQKLSERTDSLTSPNLCKRAWPTVSKYVGKCVQRPLPPGQASAGS